MILRLTDGDIVCDLAGGVEYGVPYDAWTPQVARLLDDGRYSDVVEEIPLHVRGATGAAALANLGRLSALLDRAERWAKGAATALVLATVVLEYAPPNGGGVIWRAAVLGGSANAATLALSPRVNDAGNYEIDGIRLLVTRRGRWVEADADRQLVENGDFEDWAVNDEPDDWTIEQGTPGAEIINEKTIVYEGANSLKMDATNLVNGEVWQVVDGLPAGLTVRVTGWAYVDAGNLIVSLYGDGQQEAQQWLGETGTVQWQRIDLVTTTGPGTGVGEPWGAYDGFVIRLLAAAPGFSVVYVDDIQARIVDVSGEVGDASNDLGVTNGDVALLPFSGGAQPIPSPTKLVIDGFRVGTRHPLAYVVVSNAARGLTAINADTLTMVTGFTKMTDSGTFSRGTQVVRYTPTDTTAKSLSFFAYNTQFSQVRRVAIFANMRNNSATTDFEIYGRSFMPYGEVRTRPVVVAASASPAPGWIYLGDLPVQRNGIFFVAMQASAASGTLDVDSFLILNLDDGLASVVAIDPSANVGASAAARLIISPNTLTAPRAEVYVTQGGATDSWSGRGQIEIETMSATPEAILLATGGDTDANRWRLVASSAALANDWYAYRLPARLVAE